MGSLVSDGLHTIPFHWLADTLPGVIRQHYTLNNFLCENERVPTEKMHASDPTFGVAVRVRG